MYLFFFILLMFSSPSKLKCILYLWLVKNGQMFKLKLRDQDVDITHLKF